MKVLLACSAGMSTSLVVTAIENYWKEQGISGNIVEARGVSEAKMIAKNYDVILLGPQVKFQYQMAKGWVVGTKIPIGVMEPQHYALANAEAIWQQIESLMKK